MWIRDRFHAVGEKYTNAVAHASGALPVLLPTLAGGGDLADLTGHVDLDDLIARLDGLFLPGSPSNVEPHRYDGEASAPGVVQGARRQLRSHLRGAINVGVEPSDVETVIDRAAAFAPAANVALAEKLWSVVLAKA